MNAITNTDLRRYYGAARGSESGMSLMEIMVVIAIIGTVMTIIGVNVVGQLDKANVETTKLQMNQVDKALQMYAIKNKGKYPSTAEGLSAAEEYMSSSETKYDAWGNEFVYLSPGPNGGAYELVSYGKDGTEGGEGTSADIRFSESR